MTRLFPLLSLLLLIACTPPEPPLRIGLLEWPPYEILRLEYEFSETSVHDVQIVSFQSPAEARRAYLTGGLDVVALTFDHLVQLHGHGSEHRAFVLIDDSRGSDSVLSKAPLDSLGDLRGKRVGLEGIEIDAYFANRLLELAALSPDDIVPVFVDFPDQIEAWENDEVDVLLTWEPVRSQLLARGAIEIFSSQQIPGEILDIFIARQSLLESRPEEMRRLSRSWFAAIGRWESDPAGAAQLLAPRLGLTPQQFLNAVEGTHLYSLAENHHMLGGSDTAFLETMQRVVESDALSYVGLTFTDLRKIFTPAVLPPLTDPR